jgi:hypothetical protein
MRGVLINNQKSTISNSQESAAPTVTCFVGYNPIEGKVPRSSTRRFPSSIGKFCRLLEYLHKHFPRQLARRSVLIRRMIRRQ